MSSGVSATLDFDISDALSGVDQLEAALNSATLSFGVDLASAIDSVSGASVDVTADASSITDSVDEALAGVDGQQLDLFADVDTSAAETEIADLSGETVDVTVEADTTEAQGQMDALAESTDGAKSGTSDLNSELTNLASGSFGASGGVGNLIKSTGSLVGVSSTATLGIGALVGVMGLSVAAASESATVQAQLATLIKTTGASAFTSADHINALATEIEHYSGFSDEAIASGAALLTTFQGIRSQPVFDRILREGADLARLPGGITDVTAAIKTLGRAVDNPTAGVSRLRRALIQLSPSQIETITNLQESGDLLGAQSALLDAVEAKVHGLARSYGNELPGQTDKAKQSIDDLGESLGGTLLPILGHIAQGASMLGNDFANWANNFGDFAGKLGLSSLGDLAHDIGLVSDTTPGASVVTALLADTISDQLTPATEANTAAQAAAEAQQKKLQDAVAATVPTLADSITAVDSAGQAFGILNASTDPQAVIDNLKLTLFAFDDFQNNIDAIAADGSVPDDFMGPAVAGFEALAGELQQLGPEVAGPLANVLADSSDAVKQQLNDLILQVQARGGDVTAVITGFTAGGMQGAVGAVNDAAPAVAGASQAAGQAGAEALDGGLATNTAATIGRLAGENYGLGVVIGINDLRGAVGGAARSILTSSGAAGAAGSYGRTVGQNFGIGVRNGIADLTGSIASQAASAVNQAQAAAHSAAGESTRRAVPQTISNGDNSLNITISPNAFPVHISGDATVDGTSIGQDIAEGFARTLATRHANLDARIAS